MKTAFGEHPDSLRIKEMVQKAVDEIGEHVESVHIFVTYRGTDKYGNFEGHNIGAGNKYAVYGQILEWMIQQEQVNRRIINHQISEL